MAAFTAIYGRYRRNAQLLSNLACGAGRHPIVQENQRTRTVPVVEAWHEVLGEGLEARQRPLLQVALSFFTWRSLVQEAGPTPDAAVGMVKGAGKAT